MYKIDFYEDNDGFSEFQTFLDDLNGSHETAKKALFKKITYQLDLLQLSGPLLREPQVKELKGLRHPLLELRPMPERVFFAFWDKDRYVILIITQKSGTRRIRVKSKER